LKQIVVDASVLVAGLFKDGIVRDLILNSDNLALCAPSYLREEIDRQIPRVAARTRLPEATVKAVLEDLLAAIDLVPRAVYSGSMDMAARLADEAGAPGDAEYIALALAIGAPVWTLDSDFRRIPGLGVFATRDVALL
jgi:predicted nucleic acid-binding protein